MKPVTKKNYIWEGRDYGEVVWRRDKVEVQGREIPLSEHDRPYLANNEDDDTHQSYEEVIITPPPVIGPPPDPPPGPCSAEDGCGHVTIMRDYPANLECGESFWFRTTHEVHGCAPPGGGAAILAWGASIGEITSSAVGAKYKAPECCHEDEVVITVSSVYGCEDKAVLTLQCECCENFEIAGPETTNPGNTWTGSLDPPCPGARVYVSSNSECGGSLSGSINDLGDEIAVVVGDLACGSITVTVEDMNEGCETPKATHSMRINQGSNGGQCQGGWHHVSSASSGGANCAVDHYPGPTRDCDCFQPCVYPETFYEGRYQTRITSMACICTWDWESGTEWEKEHYPWGIDPCGPGYDQELPGGFSAEGVCRSYYDNCYAEPFVNHSCLFSPRTYKGEVVWGTQTRQWKGQCT